MKTYSDKLLDPRWQKRRLEVLQGAKWKCELCGDDKSTLHVHHVFYIPGREPWEYDDQDGALVCLCEHHHEYAHGKECRDSEFSTAILAWRLAEAERLKTHVPYVDPFPYMVKIDAAKGNPDAIALAAILEKAA